MERSEIVSRAEKYVAAERDASFTEEVRLALERKDFADLEDRFYRDLEFGTGGLRGIIGGGTNRMNTLVVTKATQGLCDYLLDVYPGERLSACVAYDSRRRSADFALATALVFAGNGIKAYLFKSLRPTPELSFAVRELKAHTGVVVTASHNPPQYNGYKAYWSDGSQVVPPHDTGIIERVQAVSSIKTMNREQALESGLLEYLDEKIDDAYVAMVKSKLIRTELFSSGSSGVKIVYTPLHGTGAMLLERILGELGLRVITVPEQREPDGEFPTVSFPNPEESAALAMAIALGKKEKASVVMATDPDSDRLGVAVPDDSGDYTLITGNQLGSLHLDYLLMTHAEKGTMPPQPVCIKSIVTTDFQAYIAKKHGVECVECLTGFKWIADVMRMLEKEGKSFVYGTEESYGHLVETEVRDKDGISAAALTAEMTLYWKSKGKTLLDRLDELYSEHGFFEEKGISTYFEGPQGMQKMAAIMDNLRTHRPIALGGIPVVTTKDLLAGKETQTASGDSKQLDLPTSDVLQWLLRDGTKVTARPSGTEPKLKFYILSRTDLSGGTITQAREKSATKIGAIAADLKKALA